MYSTPDQMATIISPLDYLEERDPLLGRVFHEVPMPVTRVIGTVFEDVVSCILDQQIRYRSTGWRYRRLKLLKENDPVSYDTILKLSQKERYSLKMSIRKEKALFLWCFTWKEKNWGALPWQELDNEVVYELLDTVNGVGKWTADMILLFTLSRENIFPLSDATLKNNMMRLYGLSRQKNLDKNLIAISQKWYPYQSLAVHYLLQWKNMV